MSSKISNKYSNHSAVNSQNQLKHSLIQRKARISATVVRDKGIGVKRPAWNANKSGLDHKAKPSFCSEPLQKKRKTCKTMTTASTEAVTNRTKKIYGTTRKSSVCNYNNAKSSVNRSYKSAENRNVRSATESKVPQFTTSRYIPASSYNKSSMMNRNIVSKRPVTMKNTNNNGIHKNYDTKLRSVHTPASLKTSNLSQNSHDTAAVTPRFSVVRNRQCDPKSSIRTKSEQSKCASKQCSDFQCRTKGILRKGTDHEKYEGPASTKHVKFKNSQDVQQASLRAKLNEWLISKGKTPSQCRHLMCFDAHMSAERKKPKPVHGRLSRDVLDKQENTLSKEEAKPRKRLFVESNDHKPLKPPALKSQRLVLTPSVASNKSNTKSSRVSFATSPKIVKSSPPAPDTAYSEVDSLQQSSEQSVSVPRSPDISMEKILDNLNSMLKECLTLYKSGCPVQNILSWLNEIEANMPQARTFAPYYACKAEVFSGNPKQALDILCVAVERNAQPSEVLANAMRNVLSPLCTPLPESPAPPHAKPTLSRCSSDSLDHLGSPHDSGASQVGTPVQSPTESNLGSAIKYRVVPGHLLPGQTPDSVTLAKVTPIRRSLRLSNRQQTPFRREIDSVSDLTLKEAKTTLFQPNPALLD